MSFIHHVKFKLLTFLQLLPFSITQFFSKFKEPITLFHVPTHYD